MPYIIDGHNLIGQMPTIALDDPDDEAKLVQLLQRYAMRHRVSMTVFFDRGTYGQRGLGGNGVSVIFARSPEDADRRIIRQIRRLTQPQQWTLVSGDMELAQEAQRRGMRVIHPREFAGRLLELDLPPPDAALRAEAEARVPGDRLGEWFQLFGVSAEEAARPVDLHGAPRVRKNRTEERREQPPGSADATAGRSRRLRDRRGRPLIKPPPPGRPDEVEEWLRFFGVDEVEE